ncbi:MAG: tetratricopeptide repeat protein [Polyangiaceae bacterium]
MNLRAFAVAPLLVAWFVAAPALAAKKATKVAKTTPAAAAGAAAAPAPTPASAASTPPASDAPAAPADEVTTQAREHFTQATKLYKDGDFDAALVRFERAYELKPNYRVLYNIGQTYFQLRQYVEARDAMTRYLKEGGDQIDAERQAAVNKDLADLQRRLANVTIHVNVGGATVLVDGKSMGLTPLREPIVVSEGQRLVSVEAPNRGVLQRQIQVAGGDQQVLTLNFQDGPRTIVLNSSAAQSEPSSRLGAGFWVTAIGAVALGAGAGVTGYLALNAQDDNRNQRKQFGVTPRQLVDSSDRAKTFALTSDLLSGAALVCAGVATVILVTSPRHPHAARLDVNLGLGSAALRGQF